jgi:hypothetical protein
MPNLRLTLELLIKAISSGFVLTTYRLLKKLRDNFRQLEPSEQFLLCLGGYAVVFFLGILLIAPTGPGSNFILFLLLLVYSCFLIYSRTKAVRVLGLVFALVFFLGATSELKAKWDFKRGQEEKTRQEKPQDAREESR